MYITAWPDHVNVGFAGLHMNADLGFSSGRADSLYVLNVHLDTPIVAQECRIRIDQFEGRRNRAAVIVGAV